MIRLEYILTNTLSDRPTSLLSVLSLMKKVKSVGLFFCIGINVIAG